MAPPPRKGAALAEELTYLRRMVGRMERRIVELETTIDCIDCNVCGLALIDCACCAACERAACVCRPGLRLVK